MKYFTFRQNNSGGSFIVNDKLDVNVIIAAANAEEANSKAQKIGIYFDGVEEGEDCECCGDRWYMTNESDGKDKPEIYGKSPSEKDNFKLWI